MFHAAINDWEAWVGSPVGARTRRRWADQHHTMKDWEVEDLRRPQQSVRTDAMQATLISLGQGGDSAAVATLLVQLRPGLGRLAAWLARTDPHYTSFDGAANEVRSTFHEVVMSHDLQRRPTKIAANIVLDVRQKLWRAAQKGNRNGEIPIGSETGPTILASAVDHVVDQLHLRSSVVDALDQMGGSQDSRRLTAELAFRTWFLGEPNTDVARELGIASNAARTRLCRLRQVLRVSVLEPLPT